MEERREKRKETSCVFWFVFLNASSDLCNRFLVSQVDVELAKQQANKPDEEDLELRKKLWLRIGLYQVYLFDFTTLIQYNAIQYTFIVPVGKFVWQQIRTLKT